MITLLGRIIKGVSLATIANLLGRAANVLIPLTIITAFGVNGQTDRFFFMLALAYFCYGNLANAISETTVPLILSGRATLTATGVGLMALCWFLLVLLAGSLWTLRSNLPGLSYALALALMAGSGMINGFATGALHAQERYALPGLSWAMRLIPLAIFVGSRQPMENLPWLALGIGAADCLRSALLVSSANIKTRAARPASVPNPLRANFSAYSAVLLGMLIMGLNPIVDRMIAGLGGPGAISILETGERVYGVLAGISTTGMMTVLLTRLSKDATQGVLGQQWPSVTRLIGVWSCFWLVVGAGCGYFALGWWLESFTALSPDQSQAVEGVYWLYLIGLPPLVLSLAYVKHLQALQHLWVLVITAMLAVLANIAFSLVLRNLLGIPGIALATTLVYVMTCGILMLTVHGLGRKSQNHGRVSW